MNTGRRQLVQLLRGSSLAGSGGPGCGSLAGAEGLIRPLHDESSVCSTSGHAYDHAGSNPSVWVRGLSASAFASTSGSQSWHSHQHLRLKHYYNFIQPVDTNQINDLLSKATLLEHAALPIAKYGQYFDPEQASSMLRRLPLLLWAQEKRTFADLKQTVKSHQLDLLYVLMGNLGLRFASILHDCSDQQIAQGLWGFAASSCPMPPELVAAVEKEVTKRLEHMPLPHVATCMWALGNCTADKASQDVAKRLLTAVAERVATAPASQLSLPPSSSSSASSSSPASASSSSAASGRSYLDHRSVVKLVQACAALGVAHAGALQRLARDAAAQLQDQLQSYDTSQGKLLPRATYRYRSVKGWLDLDKPLPPKRSKYLRDSETRPRVLLRDYTPPSLARLLEGYAALAVKPAGPLEGLLATHALAAGPQRVAPRVVLRIAAACSRLDLKAPELLASLLAGCQLSQLSARDLLGLAHAAAAQGLALTSARSGPLFTRLARGITSRMELVGAGAAARVKGQQLAGDQVTAAEAASLLVLCSKAQCRDTATLGLLAARLAEHKSELPAVAAANVALAVVRLGLVAAAPAAAVQLLQRAAAAVNEEHAAGRRLPKGVAGRAAVALIQANAPGTAAKAAAGGSGAAGGSVSQEALREAAAKVVAGLKLDELSDKQKAVIAKDYAARGKTLPQALQSIALVP